MLRLLLSFIKINTISLLKCFSHALCVFTFKNVIFNKADKGKVSVAAGATIDRSLE